VTAIRGQIAPTAQEGDVGIHSLDPFVLSVPDGAVAESFYTEFGLDVRAKDNALDLKTLGCGTPRNDLSRSRRVPRSS